jgi:hypothetical protein
VRGPAAVFAAYLLLVIGGLSYFTVVGLLQR